MTYKIIEVIGADISSRARASRLRDELVRAVSESHGIPVELDFSEVRTISESFADELFAVLVHEHGEEWFRLHVRVTGLQPLPRRTVLEAIANRNCTYQ